MVKRYYNMKIGNPRINGSVICVDTSLPPESRLSDHAQVYTQGKMQFTSLDAQGTRYKVIDPEIKIVNDHLAEGSAAVRTGKKKT